LEKILQLIEDFFVEDIFNNTPVFIEEDEEVEND